MSKLAEGQVILVEMGYEEIPLSDALRCFSLTDIQEWFQRSVFPDDAEPNYKELVRLLEWDISADKEDLIDEMIQEDEELDLTPKKVHVCVAKAVYMEHRWVKVVSLTDGKNAQTLVTECEMAAIRLGDEMRRVLGLSAIIINDSKDAVKRLKDSVNNIRWMKRGNVKAAHYLKIENASKVFLEKVERDRQ